MASKMVVDRQKSATMVIASGNDNAERLATKLSEILGLPPENISALTRALTSKLQQTMDAAVAADHDHLAELADDDPVRAQRDEAATATQNTLGKVRDIVGAAFGEGAVHELGLDLRTPIDPVQLQSHGSMVLKRLTAWTPPATCQLEGYVFRADFWKEKLSTSLNALTSSLAAVAREKREADASLVAKNRAIDQSDRMFALTATMLSAMLEAAGESELASRVRPSKRRAGQTDSSESSDSTETTEGGTTEPATG